MVSAEATARRERALRRRRQLAIRRTVALCGLLVVAVVAVGLAFAGSAARIPGGTKIAGIDVEGLSAREAVARLEAFSEKLRRTPVSFRAGEASLALSASQLGVVADWERAVDEALPRRRRLRPPARDPSARAARRRSRREPGRRLVPVGRRLLARPARGEGRPASRRRAAPPDGRRWVLGRPRSWRRRPRPAARHCDDGRCPLGAGAPGPRRPPGREARRARLRRRPRDGAAPGASRGVRPRAHHRRVPVVRGRAAPDLLLPAAPRRRRPRAPSGRTEGRALAPPPLRVGGAEAARRDLGRRLR